MEVRLSIDDERELEAQDPGSFLLALTPSGAPAVQLRVTVYRGLVYAVENGRPVLTAADLQRATEWLRETSARGPLAVQGDSARFVIRPRPAQKPE